MSLYAVIRESDGLVKIGKSENADVRIMNHKRERGMTHILAVCPGDLKEEAHIHSRLKPHRVGSGREWYQDGPEVRAEIEAMRLEAISSGWALPVRGPVLISELRTNYGVSRALGLGMAGTEVVAGLAVANPTMAIQFRNDWRFPRFGVRWLAGDGAIRVAHRRLLLRESEARLRAAQRDVEACETELARVTYEPGRTVDIFQRDGLRLVQ